MRKVCFIVIMPQQRDSFKWVEYAFNQMMWSFIPYYNPEHFTLSVTHHRFLIVTLYVMSAAQGQPVKPQALGNTLVDYKLRVSIVILFCVAVVLHCSCVAFLHIAVTALIVS